MNPTKRDIYYADSVEELKLLCRTQEGVTQIRDGLLLLGVKKVDPTMWPVNDKRWEALYHWLEACNTIMKLRHKYKKK